MTELHGIDISNYQAGLKLANTDAQFVIIKASEGTTYVDPYCDGFVKQAQNLGLPWGTYHFYAGGSGTAEADHYLDTVGGYVGKGLLVLDFERNTSNRTEPTAFLNRILAQTGVAPVLYISGSVATAGGWTDVAKQFALWSARWGTSNPGDTGPWSGATLWQYTDSYPTGGMQVDADYFFGDRAAWTALATGGGTSTISEDQPPTEGSIQTPYGQQGTAWASGYHQGDDWHRGAGAAEIGDPIWAVAAGKIIYAGDARTDGGQGWGSSFGIHVLNQWDDHGRTSIDAHMSKLHVKTGDHVQVGDLIGEKGDTGNVSGPHDHHEQHTGTGWTDPDVKPIYPGKPTTTGGGSGNGEDFDVSEQKPTMKRTKAQTIKPTKNNTYEVIRLEDSGDVSFGFGGGRWEVHCRVKLSSVSAAEELMMRVTRIDTDPKKDDKQVGDATDYLAVGLPGGGGSSWRLFDWKWHVPAPSKGLTRRLRISVANFADHDMIIESVDTTAWSAPL